MADLSSVQLTLQCFIQRVGNLGFPTHKPLPPQALLTSAIYLYYTFPPQEHHVPYLAISKIMILYQEHPSHVRRYTSPTELWMKFTWVNSSIW